MRSETSTDPPLSCGYEAKATERMTQTIEEALRSRQAYQSSLQSRGQGCCPARHPEHERIVLQCERV